MSHSNPSPDQSPPRPRTEALESLAAQKRTSLAAELWQFLKHNKKWWLLPLIVMLLLLGALVALGSTAVAPFIYTLF